MLSALYAIANLSVCSSVLLSVTRVDQSKTVELRIVKFPPYSSPIPLLFAISFIQKFRRDPPERGRQTRVGWGNEPILSVFHAFARWQHKLDIQSLQMNLNSKLIAKWRLCRALTPASARLSCLPSPGDIAIRRLCLLVCLFVR